jgi:DNA-binding protein
MPENQRNSGRRRDKAGDNMVFVGRKPSMAYVLAVVTQFSENRNEIHIKARGKSISKAVDVAEIVRKKFVQDAKISSITTDTEELEVENNEKINVSTIEIILKK